MEIILWLAHHYPKGKQGNKPIVDCLVGSGVVARDADTIIALTEHREPGCLTMEFVLRNFADQEALVVERQLPRFLIREDLEPAALDGKDDGEKVDKNESLLGLLGPEGLVTSQSGSGAPKSTLV